MRSAAEWIETECGRLDILINNAGIARGDGHGLPSETTVETLRAVYETNVFSVVAVTNAMLTLLRRSPGCSDRQRLQRSRLDRGDDRPEEPARLDARLGYLSVVQDRANMITAMYAKELQDTPIRVNAANPGYCATDLNVHSGFRTAEQGAQVSVHLATVPDDGPTGQFWGNLWSSDDPESNGVLPW